MSTRIFKGTGPDAAIIIHPHPLLGGSNRDHVVTAVAEYLVQKRRCYVVAPQISFSLLSFGKNEAKEVTRIYKELKSRYNKVYLFGYSWGASIVSLCHNADEYILISPALKLRWLMTGWDNSMERLFNTDKEKSENTRKQTVLLVYGDRDQFTSKKTYSDFISKHRKSAVNSMFKYACIPEADHFYQNTEPLIKAINEMLST